MDTIFIRNLETVARHGVYDEERAEGRMFSVDVEVDLPTTGVAGQSDALAETVDYRDIAACVCDVLAGPSVHLIERLAEEICDAVLVRIPRVVCVRIELRKRATGVPGAPEWVGLRIARRRGSAGSAA